MNRIFLSDGTNRWFDQSVATEYEEDTRFDGRNQISINTGSQWHHETVYRTSGGKWVLCEFSSYLDRPDRYGLLDSEDAAVWLARNGHKIPKSLTGYLPPLEI